LADHEIQIFKAAPVAGDGRPVVVVAAGQIDFQLVAEYYAFVCNNENSFYSQRIQIHDQSVNLGSKKVNLDPNFMISFGRTMAEERLNVHLMNKQSSATAGGGSGSVYRLEEADSYEFVRLYLQGKYDAEIKFMHESTGFEVLARMVWQLQSLKKAVIVDLPSPSDSQQ
jgi:hypothetical protein